MKYIRTINGKIIDVKDALKRYKNGESLDDITLDIVKCIVNGTTEGYGYARRVKKEADTIEGLIMHDDLVEYDGINYSRIEKVRGDYFVGTDLRIIPKGSVTAVYMAHGVDVQCEVEELTFVARKDEDDGRWELL